MSDIRPGQPHCATIWPWSRTYYASSPAIQSHTTFLSATAFFPVLWQILYWTEIYANTTHPPEINNDKPVPLISHKLTIF